MRISMLLLGILLFTTTSFAQVYVEGYSRKDGTYVSPHYRSSPNSSKWDNYGPSTSSSGTQSPYSRDNDSDGSPNLYDYDDDNDGISDDYDSSQY